MRDARALRNQQPSPDKRVAQPIDPRESHELSARAPPRAPAPTYEIPCSRLFLQDPAYPYSLSDRRAQSGFAGELADPLNRCQAKAWMPACRLLVLLEYEPELRFGLYMGIRIGPQPEYCKALEALSAKSYGK